MTLTEDLPEGPDTVIPVQKRSVAPFESPRVDLVFGVPMSLTESVLYCPFLRVLISQRKNEISKFSSPVP